MSDLIVDLRGLLRRLHEHDVDYVLFGALAMVFYGYVRNTEDLDIAIDLEPENLDRVTEWPQLIAEAELYEIEGMRVRVMNRRTLIELKRLRGSNQDLADIEAIELLADL